MQTKGKLMDTATLEQMTDTDLGDYMSSLLQQVSTALTANDSYAIISIQAEIFEAVNEWEYRNQ
jgi:hypothetical protein